MFWTAIRLSKICRKQDCPDDVWTFLNQTLTSDDKSIQNQLPILKISVICVLKQTSRETKILITHPAFFAGGSLLAAKSLAH